MVVKILAIVCVAAGAILITYNRAAARDAAATAETMKTTTRTLAVLNEIVFSVLTIIDLLQGVKSARKRSRNRYGGNQPAYAGTAYVSAKYPTLGHTLLTTEQAEDIDEWLE